MFDCNVCNDRGRVQIFTEDNNNIMWFDCPVCNQKKVEPFDAYQERVLELLESINSGVWETEVNTNGTTS